MSDADWQRVIDVDMNAAVWLSRACLPGMVKKGWGRIVNFAGMNAIHGHAGRAPVSVAKHGVWGLTKALAMEFGPKGITTNTISPGPIAPDVEEKNASTGPRKDAGPRPARPLRHAGRGRRGGAAARLGGRRLHQRPDDPGERRRRDLTDKPHPEERPQARVSKGESSLAVAHASRRPLGGLVSMRWWCSDRLYSIWMPAALMTALHRWMSSPTKRAKSARLSSSTRAPAPPIAA